MKFCTECGAQLADSAKFCGECGTPIGASTTTFSEQSPYRRTALRIDPDVSAEFFIEKVSTIINRQAQKLEDWKELWGAKGVETFPTNAPMYPFLNPHPQTLQLLRSDVEQLRMTELTEVIAVHNYAVLALRFICDEELKKFEKVQVRDDLSIPRDWQVHYENLLRSNSPQLILAVLQHVFTGNPLSGELYEWSNQRVGFLGRNNGGTGKSLIGLSVVGAAAAWLLSG